MITRATEYSPLLISWLAVAHWAWTSADSRPILMPIWPPPPTTAGVITFIPVQAQFGDIATVVVNPTRCPGLRRQISTDTFLIATARFLPTVRRCHMYSRRELPIRWRRLSCRSNIPRPHTLPDITMGCTLCHHARLLNRSRVRYQTPTFLSVIQPLRLPLPPRVPANRRNS
jgi:hypothetical protein